MSDDEERFKNLILCNVFATDKEFEEMAPALGVVILVFLGIVGVCAMLGVFE